MTGVVWDVHSGKKLSELRGHKGEVWGAKFSPNGKLVLTKSRDGTARIWDPVNGKILTELHGHSGPIYEALFSPDGKFIVTGSEDESARIYHCDLCSGSWSLSNLLDRARERVIRIFNADVREK